MSNAQPPKHETLLPIEEQSTEDIKASLLGRTQELQHVQERFSPNVGNNAPVTGTTPTGVPASQQQGRFATLTEDSAFGASRVAAVLRLVSAGFGLLAAVLFVLPGLDGTFSVPSTPQKAEPTYTVIAPTMGSPAAKESGEGVTEQTTPFEGASVLVIESEPSGVFVQVAGKEKGQTPVSLTLDCVPGTPLRIVFSKKGLERAQHTTLCRGDTMIKLFARMRKPEKKGGASSGAKP